MKRIFLVLVGALLLSGCAKSTQANSEFSSADISFAEQMIPHHEQAIEMAQEVAASTNKDVADLSASIIAAQQLEIAKMNALLIKS
jgi:uncharacterized protein (DUF305 family)